MHTGLCKNKDLLHSPANHIKNFVLSSYYRTARVARSLSITWDTERDKRNIGVKYTLAYAFKDGQG